MVIIKLLIILLSPVDDPIPFFKKQWKEAFIFPEERERIGVKDLFIETLRRDTKK